VAVPTTVTSGGASYAFSSWSDGSTDPARGYEVPVAGGSLTANYTPIDTTPPPTQVALTNTKNWLYGFLVVGSGHTLHAKVTVAASEQSGPVALALTLSDAAGVLGTATGSVAPGAATTVDVVLSAATYQRIKAASWKGLNTTLKTVATDASGNATTVTTSARLHS